MNLQTTDPRAQREAGRTGGHSGHPNHTTSAPWFNGNWFRCCWCGAFFPWSGVGAFTPLGPGRALRWCDDCADAYEQLANPPVYYAGDRR